MLIDSYNLILGLCVALGIGLLIGAERERRKITRSGHKAAGIRTFAIASLLGAVSVMLGETILLGIALLIVGQLALVAYRRTRDQDPGMTTEIALLLTCLLGGLAMSKPLLSAGLGTVLVSLLLARSRIHNFVKSVLSEQELHDAILFLAATLILLPLAPDLPMGPFQAINPHTIVSLIVLIMGISAIGHIATRILGSRYGLPLAGFASGFISSTATIHAMGIRAAKAPTQLPAAVAGAVLSSIATILQTALIIFFIQPDLIKLLYKPLLFGGVVAALYSLVFTIKGLSIKGVDHEGNSGHAFGFKTAIVFAAILSSVMLVSAALTAWYGPRGVLFAAGFSGLVDAHASAASVATLVAHNKMMLKDAVLPVLVGLTSNTIVKGIVAMQSGGTRYASQVVPGLVLILVAVWLGLL